MYINGSLIASYASGTITNTQSSHRIGWQHASVTTAGANFLVDEHGIWSRALSAAEVSQLYNNGQGFAYPFVAATNFTIYAEDYNDGSVLSNFNASIGAINYTGSGNNITTGLLSNSTQLYNVTVYVPNYYPITYLNVNVSSALTTRPYQAIVNLQATEKITSAPIQGTFTFGSQASSNTLYLKAGTATITFNKTGYFNKTTQVTLAALDNTSVTVANVTNRRLNFTAMDLYDNSNLTAFNVSISAAAYSYSENLSTNNGSIVVDVVDSALYNASYNAADYFDVTYTSHNASVNLTAKMYQILVKVQLTDYLSGDPINTFNVTSGTQYNATTNGTAYIYAKLGSLPLTLRAFPYDDLVTSYNFTTPVQQINLTFSLAKKILFNIVDEITLAPFRMSAANSSTLSVLCSNQSYEYQLNISANQSSIYADVCPYEFIRLELSYGSTGYFRTLQPPYTSTNATFYMADATQETLYQINILLNDITGQYINGDAILRKTIINGTYEIISQPFDAEGKVVLYLIKDNFYTLSIRDQHGNERSIGLIVADAAGTKTITVPTIAFLPDNVVDGGTITYQWQGNSSTIRLLYNDTSVPGTSRIDFAIYNAENASTALYSTFSLNVHEVTFTYLGLSNESYMACLNSTANITGCAIYVGYNPLINASQTQPWSARTEHNVWNILTLIIVCFIVFAFGKASPAAALTIVTAFMGVMTGYGLFLVISMQTTIALTALVGLMAVISFFIEVNK